MERIQYALEKARAAREGVAPEVHPPTGPTPSIIGADDAAPVSAPTEAPADSTRVAANWEALTEVRVTNRALMRGHIVAATGERDAIRFDVTRTKLLHHMRSNGWQRVAITSPGPACGKTTLALNLAYGLARQADLRVVLVDADLRRPSVARLLGLKPVAGVADFLEGRADLTEVALRPRPNLAILANRVPHRSATELFQSPRSAEALDALEAALRPSIILFDLPPALTGDDVMAFAAHVDCAVIVAGAGSTTIAEIDACERELAARTNVVGVVVNKCRYLGKDYGYSEYG